MEAAAQGVPAPSPPSADRRTAVDFEHVSKAYGQVTVLRDLNLAVPAGQKLAIIGRSGSGKTTLLRLIMTLTRADAGLIRIFGQPLGVREVGGRFVPDTSRQLHAVRGRIGMVFQHFNLFPHMTAIANVMEAPVRVAHMPRAQARREALELLGLVGLADKADARPHQLSGGQQQRVAIARALAMKPQIMLFDEVTSALDPELVGEVLKVIRQIARDSGMTMLIVTHEMTFARDIADRVVFMDKGTIAEDGPPDRIFTRPENARTREFLRAILER